MSFQRIASKSEIADGEMKSFEVNGDKIVVFNLGGEFFALSDVCSHAGCLLSENGQIEGDLVECICHGSKFNIKDGQVVEGPAFEPMPVYEVKVEGDDILVYF